MQSEKGQNKSFIEVTAAPRSKTTPPFVVRLPPGINDHSDDPFKFKVSHIVGEKSKRIVRGLNDYIEVKADNFSPAAQAQGADSKFVKILLIFH